MKSFKFNLKITNQSEIVKPINENLNSIYGPETSKKLIPTIKNVQSLRNEINFIEWEMVLSADAEKYTDLQNKLALYVRYLFLLDKYFSSGPFPPQISFAWNDSFDRKSQFKTSIHLKYELASALYNLGILFYSHGVQFSVSGERTDKLKGIAKLRNAVWCFTEVKNIIPTLMSIQNDLPDDMTFDFNLGLINYIVGYVFEILTELQKKDNELKHEKLASLFKTTAKHFQMAFDLFTHSKNLIDTESLRLKANLLYNSLFNKASAYYRISLEHSEKVRDDLKGGHMGLAISYIEVAKSALDELVKNKKELELLSKEQKEEVEVLFKTVYEKLENWKVQNAKVYGNQPVYNVNQLNEIPEEKTSITGVEPKDIKAPLDEEKDFNNYLNPEILKLKKELSELGRLKTEEVETFIKSFIDSKENKYNQASITHLLHLDLDSGESEKLPQNLNKLIENVKKSGAEKGFNIQISAIQESQARSANKLQLVKDILDKEAAEDAEARKKYQNKWTRSQSDKINHEYYLKIKDLDNKVGNELKKNATVFKKIETYNSWLKKFSSDYKDILALIPPDSDKYFIEANKAEIGNLAKKDKEVEEILNYENLRSSLNTIFESFEADDHTNYLVPIIENPNLKDENLKMALKSLDDKFIPILNKIKQVEKLIEKMAEETEKIIQKKKEIKADQRAKILEEMNVAASELNKSYIELQQSFENYLRYTKELEILEKTVQDFVFARNIEKENNIQEIEAENDYSNMNTSSSYFLGKKFHQFKEKINQFNPFRF